MKSMIVWIGLAYLCGLTLVASQVSEVVVSKTHEYDASEVIDKSPEQLVELRGFTYETHYARTKDGYHLHVVRIINPRISTRKLRRPVIFNHGLLESGTIWLINARGIQPSIYSQCDGRSFERFHIEQGFNETHYINGPLMLSHHGYDVWIMSMRGTEWSSRHDTLKDTDKDFWNYCLDDFALVDVPTVVDYVRRTTGQIRVGYIGHSQATFSVFGLLASRPGYADVIEPVVAVAPVSYFDHITSIARLLFMATLTATDKNTHGPFPTEAHKMRIELAKVCGNKKAKLVKSTCDLIEMLISGFGKKWKKGYYSHLPFRTSLKILRHFGQLIKHKRFMMYDYGASENLRLYGTIDSPSYPIKEIRSKSIVLVSTKTDALSQPEDVERFRSNLKVAVYKNIIIDKAFDHFDIILNEEAGRLVFKPILEVFRQFERKSGTCRVDNPNYKEEIEQVVEKKEIIEPTANVASVETVPEAVIEKEKLLEKEQLVENAPIVEKEPIVANEPIVATKPLVGEEPIVASQPIVEQNSIVEPVQPVAVTEPLEVEAVAQAEPAKEALFESEIDENRLPFNKLRGPALRRPIRPVPRGVPIRRPPPLSAGRKGWPRWNVRHFW